MEYGIFEYIILHIRIMINKVKGKWILSDKDGKEIGRFGSKEAAKEFEKGLEDKKVTKKSKK